MNEEEGKVYTQGGMTGHGRCLMIVRWVGLGVLLWLGVVMPGTLSRPKITMAQSTTPLNIVVIMTDDQRWDTLWAMPMVQEELVRRGVEFNNAFVSTPLCCPERASFLAGGFYAHNTGVLTNEMPNGGAAKFLDSDTLPVRLQRSGYQTAMIGKYLNEYWQIDPYIPPGWTKFIQTTGGNDWMNYTATIGSSGPDASALGTGVSVSQYLTDFLLDEALTFIRQAGSSPFFLYLAPFAPHTPAVPAPGDETLFTEYHYRGRGYKEEDLSDKPMLQSAQKTYDTIEADNFHRQQLQSLQAVDRAVGNIVRALKTLGKLNSTLIVYMSDNGYLWGEHWLRAKGHPYEEAIRVPLVVVMPGITPRSDGHLVVANLDLPTTIFEVAGIPRHDTDGRSLLPLLHDSDTDWRTEFLIEMYWKPAWAGLRTTRYKYVEWAFGQKIFFDLRRDTYELENQINNPAYQAIITDLATRLSVVRGLAVVTPDPPKGKVGRSFTFQLVAWGGTRPYTWRLTEGGLPPGITLDAARGLIAGKPTQAGTFRASIQVSDVSVSPYSGQPQTHVRHFTFTINPY